MSGTSGGMWDARWLQGFAAAIPSSSARASAGNVSSAAARFSRRCVRDDVPGINRMIGRAVQQPCQGDLHRRGPEPARDGRQRGRLERREPAEREERHVGDALPGQVVDERVVLAVGQVVEVLDAHDLGDRLRLGHLGGRDVAQADVADQPLTLQVGQDLDLIRDRPLRRLEHPADAEIHDVERVEAEILEVIVNARDQVVLAVRRPPRGVLAPDRPELGDDHQALGVRVQGLGG